jgi:hypothetical protein
VSQLHPFFQQVDFHRQLADLALKLSDLPLVLGDVNRFGQVVGELARLVFADPKPNQIARETMPARELMQPCAPVEKLFRDLTLELRTEPPMPSNALSSDKALARSNSSLPFCPVLGVHRPGQFCTGDNNALRACTEHIFRPTGLKLKLNRTSCPWARSRAVVSRWGRSILG